MGGHSARNQHTPHDQYDNSEGAGDPPPALQLRRLCESPVRRHRSPTPAPRSAPHSASGCRFSTRSTAARTSSLSNTVEIDDRAADHQPAPRRFLASRPRELTLSIDDFSARYIEPAIAVLAATIEAQFYGMCWPAVWNQVGTAGAAQTFKTVLQSQEVAARQPDAAVQAVAVAHQHAGQRRHGGQPQGPVPAVHPDRAAIHGRRDGARRPATSGPRPRTSPRRPAAPRMPPT